MQGQTERRLTKLGVMEKVPAQNIINDRTEALRQAVISISGSVTDVYKAQGSSNQGNLIPGDLT